MADVFYAVAPAGAPVAVKVLRAAAGARRSCQREYELAHAVDADCTAPALDYGRSAAGAYLVTAYLPGYRCGTTMLGRSMPAARLWTLGLALARVLAAVHARDIVHCDVKPSNLLVRGHDVRLIDFGIARYAGQRCGGDGTVECSRGWAAPEQLRAAPATPAVDVFAWGCVLAYLASGVHPFASQGEQEWILRVQSAEPDLAGVPAGLHEVIRQSLARDPRERPSAGELATICHAHGDAGPRPMRRVRLAGPRSARPRRLPTRLATRLRRWLRTLRRTLQDGLPPVVACRRRRTPFDPKRGRDDHIADPGRRS
jgi:serine/threonine protein kinase